MNCDNDKFAKSAYGKKKSNKLRSVLDSSSDEEQTQKYYSQTDSDEENTPSIIGSELSSSSWHLRQSKIDLPIIPPEKENYVPGNDSINDDELGLSDNLPQNRNDLFEPEHSNVPLEMSNERPLVPLERANNFPTNDNINDDELGLSDNLPQNRNDLFEPQHSNVPLEMSNERPLVPLERANNFPTNDNINDDELGLSDNLPQNRNDLFEPEHSNVPLEMSNERPLVPLERANNFPTNDNINDDELGLADNLPQNRNDVFVPEHNNVPLQVANERQLVPLQQENYVPRNDNINNEGPENVVEGLLPPMIAPIVDEVIVDENNPYGLIAAYAKVTYRRLQKLDLLRPAYQEPYEPLGMVGDMVSLNI
ncbi:hypothetical protein TKK_0013885 [Trichogramma kaykai]